jgi:hypothetical protein
LPSVTLGKGFAECKIAFAVCLEHTAKKLIPVVLGEDVLSLTVTVGGASAHADRLLLVGLVIVCGLLARCI